MYRGLDPKTSDALKVWRATIDSEALEVVNVTFPAKILHLNALIASSHSPSSPFDPSVASSHAPSYTPSPAPSPSPYSPDSKKRKLENGAVDAGAGEVGVKYRDVLETHKHVAELLQQLKRECEELVEGCDKIKLYINLRVPCIEDGDNSGVAVQEEALAELHRAQESAYNLRDAAGKYFASRGKAASKIVKYPGLEDYKLALQELDDRQLYLARQHLHDLRSIFVILVDVIHKNIAKIKQPKGNNQGLMY